MTNFDWPSEILEWTKSKRKVRPYEHDLIEFFKKAFNHTAQPEKSFFGTSTSGISLVVGGIYLAALGEGRMIYLLLDREITNIPNSETHITKSTRDFDSPLYWFYTEDLSQLKAITENQEIWESFQVASDRIFENKRVTAYRSHIAKNKIQLSEFWKVGDPRGTISSTNQLEQEFQEKVSRARTLSQEERQKKITGYPRKPRRLLTTQIEFYRNPYVVVEVLERAGGICVNCNRPAPFIKDANQQPYLEVHHIKPLAEGGDDTVENAMALCPNCHRHAHYGIKSYRSKHKV